MLLQREQSNVLIEKLRTTLQQKEERLKDTEHTIKTLQQVFLPPPLLSHALIPAPLPLSPSEASSILNVLAIRLLSSSGPKHTEHTFKKPYFKFTHTSSLAALF